MVLFIFTALEISKIDTKALYRCAQAYDGLGKMKEALETIRRLIYLDPKNKTTQSFARNLEAKVSAHVAEAESITGRLNKMFEVICDKNSSVEKLEQALNNVSILIKENFNFRCTIWNHPKFSFILELTKNYDQKVVIGCHRLLAQIIEKNSEWVCYLYLNYYCKFYKNCILTYQCELYSVIFLLIYFNLRQMNVLIGNF